MKGIIPHLWFDTQAVEAAKFYTSLLDNSRITATQTLEGTPSGDTESVSFELAGQPFMAISAGPYFKFNPSLSLMVQCSSKEEVDKLWHELSKDGKVLMELAEYPYSKWYGWLEDRYGLSWQLLLADHPIEQKIIPHFLFSQEEIGKTEEAIKFYTGIFHDTSIDELHYYESSDQVNPKAKVMFSSFHIGGIQFSAMDNAYDSDFTFNEAFSLLVLCEDQKEVDYYWDKLSAVPEAEQCGWLQDKFGVSWQIVPEQMNEVLASGTREQINNVTQAFLQMKKLDIAELERVWKETK